ncbi:MAG: hypothetical protein H6704_17530 [Myxococcales bacterium]|nr:hypothetical protein [Myxococcales bacterium]MCB9538058.1 hypothetical protein [Myxococcales bacterium]
MNKPPLPRKLMIQFAIMGLAIAAEAYAAFTGKPRSMGLVLNSLLLGGLLVGSEAARDAIKALAYLTVVGAVFAIGVIGFVWSRTLMAQDVLMAPLLASIASLINGVGTLWCLEQPDVGAWLLHRALGRKANADAPAVAPAPGDFACGTCSARYAAVGTCTTCRDEPLLDLRDGDIRLMLVEDDDRRVLGRQRTLLVGAIPFGVAATIAAGEFVPGASAMIKSLPFGFGFILSSVGLTMGLAGLAGRKLSIRRRFPDLV